MQVTNLCPIFKIMRDFEFVCFINYALCRQLLDELFEQKDLFGQVHYFLSALCSSLLIKKTVSVKCLAHVKSS